VVALVRIYVRPRHRHVAPKRVSAAWAQKLAWWWLLLLLLFLLLFWLCSCGSLILALFVCATRFKGGKLAPGAKASPDDWDCGTLAFTFNSVESFWRMYEAVLIFAFSSFST
jgi:hypothetical protein